MSEGFDPNKAVGEIVAKLVDNNFSKIWNSGKGAVKSAYTDAKVFATSHKRYITQVAKDYYKAKSFLIQQTKTPLYNFYVPLGLSRGETEYSEASISNLTLVENFNVITGSGGSGKSMMMRHLFLDTLKEKDKVPVFVELRDLNGTELTILNLIGEALYQNKFTRDDEFFEKAMKAGHFAIFLDGFDETDDRQKITKEIQKLAKDYDENIITVSSRPDDAFSAWTLFNIWKIQPLTLEKACDLIEKVPTHVFDAKLKNKFLADLKEKLFESHKSFLSNPLLLSIMVLTYKDSADIPNKLSVFYDQAYTTLFQRHDALKGGYKRKRYCDLDIQDFAKVFSAFSILTHDKRKSSLTEKEALEFLGKAKKLINIEFDEKGFIDDAIQAVSLLVREGLIITFSHRSFQEYFAAEYIRQIPPDKQRKLIRKYFGFGLDNVINLLYSIDPELVETSFLIPEIKEIEGTINYDGKLNDIVYRKFLEAYINDFRLSPSADIKTGEITSVDYFPSFIEFGNKIFNVFDFVYQNYVQKQIFNNYIDLRVIKEFSSKVKISLLKNEGINIDEKYKASDFMHDRVKETHKISLQNILDNSELYNFMMKKYHPFSLSMLKAVLKVKDSLVEKHKNKELSIEEELLS